MSRHKIRYWKLVAIGLCVKCAQRKPKPGGKRCIRCAKKASNHALRRKKEIYKEIESWYN